MAFGETWDETTPAGTADANTLDTIIQGVKTSIRERLQLGGMYFPATHDEEAGLHSYILFKEQASKPTAAANKFFLYTKEATSKSEMFMENEDGTEDQLTEGGDWIGGMVGEVRMWSGAIADIPTGWVICDGNNGSPNLIAKFVRCVATAATEPGSTGGADTIDIAHTHGAGSFAGPSHQHDTTVGSVGGGGSRNDFRRNAFGTGGTLTATGGGSDSGAGSFDADLTKAEGTGAVTGTSASAGSAAQSILPTYHELAFIYKT